MQEERSDILTERRVRTSIRAALAIRAFQASLALVVLVTGVAIAPSTAIAVSSSGQFAVSVTPAGAGMYANYTLASFTTGNKETTTRVAITFPAQCDISGATALNPNHYVISRTGSTVVLGFTTPYGPRTTFAVPLGNVRNPVTPGTYSIASPIVFTLQGGGTSNVSPPGRRLEFTILASPYIVMTVETPGDLQAVDFGTVDPGVTSAGQLVRVTVDSSADFTISRGLTGQFVEMGLGYPLLPTGPQLAGVRVFDDVLTVTPPWVADPGTYTAQIQYTAVQN